MNGAEPSSRPTRPKEELPRRPTPLDARNPFCKSNGLRLPGYIPVLISNTSHFAPHCHSGHTRRPSTTLAEFAAFQQQQQQPPPANTRRTTHLPALIYAWNANFVSWQTRVVSKQLSCKWSNLKFPWQSRRLLRSHEFECQDTKAMSERSMFKVATY